MTSRKKNLLLIQITIFLVASALLYNTYRNKNTGTELLIRTEVNSDPDTNSFTDIEYSGFDLKDGTILTVISDEGIYNNISLDMKFINNVKAEYLTHIILADVISYSNSNAKLIATGNVRGESIEKGEFIADNVEYDLTYKSLNFSMFGSKQVNVKLKN